MDRSFLSVVLKKKSTQLIHDEFFLFTGLAELALKKYKSAAKHFLQAQFDHFEYKEVKMQHKKWSVFLKLSKCFGDSISYFSVDICSRCGRVWRTVCFGHIWSPGITNQSTFQQVNHFIARYFWHRIKITFASQLTVFSRTGSSISSRRRSPARTISYWSSVTTGGNLN